MKTSIRTKLAAGVLALSALIPGALAVGGVTAVATVASVATAPKAEAMDYLYPMRATYKGDCWWANVYRTNWIERHIYRMPEYYTQYSHKIYGGPCGR